MKAAVVEEWGVAPVYADFPDPTARDGVVVAEVEASALTNLTRGVISGKHYTSKNIALPAIPGVDGVARLSDGRRVYAGALGSYGLMAERTLVQVDGAVEIPEGVDSVTAAAIPNPGVSAWMSLQYGAAITPGAHVLVLGATGVTGSTAVQLAATEFGAERVVVVGRTAERLDWLRTVGADAAVSLGDDDAFDQIAALHAERPFDAVLDYLWGTPAERVLTALADATQFHATRFVQIGAMADPTISLPSAILRSSGITLSGIGIGSVPPEVMNHARTEALPRLFDLVSSGRLSLNTTVRKLADVAEVWATKEPSGTRTVLVP